jgi:plastocyanin
MDKKKEIIIGVVVVVIVVAGYFVYVGTRSNSNQAIPNASTTAVGTQTSMGTVTSAGVVAATGTSAVASSGIVVAPSGAAAQNNVTPGAPTAPQESSPVASVSAIPSAAVKLTVSVSGGFTPNAFTVSAGAPVTISVTSGDAYSHVFAFEDASLSAVAVGVGPSETRAITFNAPKTAGAYKFYSNIPGQSGEAGVMTVK